MTCPACLQTFDPACRYCVERLYATASVVHATADDFFEDMFEDSDAAKVAFGGLPDTKLAGTLTADDIYDAVRKIERGYNGC